MEQGVGNLDYFMEYFYGIFLWHICMEYFLSIYICILQKNDLPIAKPKPYCDKNVDLYIQALSHDKLLEA